MATAEGSVMILLLMFGMLFQTPDWIIVNQDGNTYNADESFHLYETLISIAETIDEAIIVLDERADWQNPYNHESRRQVTVVYPSQGRCPVSCYDWKGLGDWLYKGKILLSKDFTETILLHEYGHFIFMVMYDWDKGNMPSRGRYDSHWYDTATDEGYALAEGFSEFFTCWVRDDAFITVSINLESNGFVGDDVEGAVASQLWDFTDTIDSIDRTPGIDDEPLGDMSTRLWRGMDLLHPQNISDINKAFKGRRSITWADIRFGRAR